MTKRLPLALSAAALVVALLGSTPLGGAAARSIAKVPPFAKRSGVAENAKRLGGRAPSAYARLDATGKLPAALLPSAAKGEPGPKGEPGAKGEKGDRGPAGLVAAYSKATGQTPFQPLGSGKTVLVSLPLPAGRYLILAQATIGPDLSKQLSTVFAGCRLSAGTEKSTVVVAGSKATTTFLTAATFLVHEFAAQGSAELDCNDAPFGESAWSNAQIVAVQVAGTIKPGPGVGNANPGGSAGNVRGG